MNLWILFWYHCLCAYERVSGADLTIGVLSCAYGSEWLLGLAFLY